MKVDLHWIPELPDTVANNTAVLEAFERQIPAGETPVAFEQVLAPGLRKVWGWFSRSAMVIYLDNVGDDA